MRTTHLAIRFAFCFVVAFAWQGRALGQADVTRVHTVTGRIGNAVHIFRKRPGGRWVAMAEGSEQVWGGYREEPARGQSLRLRANASDTAVIDLKTGKLSIERRGGSQPWGAVVGAHDANGQQLYPPLRTLGDGRQATRLFVRLHGTMHTLSQRSTGRWEASGSDGKVWGGYSVDRHDAGQLHLRANATDLLEVDFRGRKLTLNRGGKRQVWGNIVVAARPDGSNIYTADPVVPPPAPLAADQPPPISAAEAQQWMAWIAAEVSAVRIPYCYKESYGLGVGKPGDLRCAEGQELNAGLCYAPCKGGYKGVANSCNAGCPAGYRDDGLFCAKPAPASYLPPAFVLWDKAKCEAAAPQGCHRKGALFYPKCKAGYHNVALHCQRDCPAGWTDSGVSCAKPSYDRGVGKPAQLACAGGLQPDAGLCYPACKDGFAATGPVCWQKCPGNRKTDCGVGCATSHEACVVQTFNMAQAPVGAALSLVTLGFDKAAANAATKGAEAAAKGGKAAKQGVALAAMARGRWAPLAKHLAKELAKQAAKKGKQGIDGAYNLLTIKDALGGEIAHWTAFFAKPDNFIQATSRNINAAVSRSYRGAPHKADYVRKLWSIYHLGILAEADGFATAANVISAASVFDITGLSYVVAVYLKPTCNKNVPFPTIAK